MLCHLVFKELFISREHGQESRPQSRAQEQVQVSSKSEMSREVRQESSHECEYEKEETEEEECVSTPCEEQALSVAGGESRRGGYTYVQTVHSL